MASVHPVADPTQEQKEPQVMMGQYGPGPAFPAMPMQPQVITQQPGVPGYVATVGPQTRDWSSGLGEICKNPTTCLYSFFCGECYTCYILPRMGENCWVGWLFPCWVGWPCPAALIPMRVKMRAQYGIQGDLCNDICTSWWCAPCVLAQLSREIDHVNGQSMVRQ